MTLLGLDRYQLTSEEASMFFAEFGLVMTSVNLETVKLNDPALTTLSNVLGVYFWMMRLGNSTYKIYVGKTNSLPRRLRDYKNEFQVHAPNDHKLRFFQAFMLEHHPDAEFDLYFIAAEGHTQKENEAVGKYSPLINEKAWISKADREAMKDAFTEYYTNIFKEKLGQQLKETPKITPLDSRKTTLRNEPKNGVPMTNHDMIARAMKGYCGKVLESSEIKKIVLKAFPAFSEGSHRPNDHALGNKSACSCAGTEERIFDRVEPNKYLVR